MTSAFVMFLDRLIAFQAMVRKGTLRVTRDLHSAEEILAFARDEFNRAVTAVSTSNKMQNPKKVASLAVTRETRKVANSLFQLRRCIEHHGEFLRSR